MKSHLINTVKQLRFCNPSPLFYAQKQNPAPKNKPKQRVPDNVDKERKAIAQELIRYIEAVNKQVNFRKEMTKFNATHKSMFRGNIVIESNKSSACATLTKILQSAADRQNQVLFVDGSAITTPKHKSGSSIHKPASTIPSGAAVVYKPLGRKKNRQWQVRLFASTSRGRGSTTAELAAIADGLIIATIERLLIKGAATNSTVTIFSDCMGALQQLNKLRGCTNTDVRLLRDPSLRSIVTTSQYLHHIGVQLELHWVPGHSHVDGNCRADKAARFAAKHQDIGKLLQEELQWDTEASIREASSNGSTAKHPSKTKGKPRCAQSTCNHEEPIPIPKKKVKGSALRPGKSVN
ncbi:hypothetical protein V8C35DRAFT_326484 [Trichoderma chlorosporum]